MKKLLISLLLPALLILAGCGTPQQRQQTVGAMLLISQAGMNAYVAIGTADCKGDALCEDQIQKVYGVYTNAVNGALTAWQTYESTGTNYSVFLKLATAVAAAEADVIKAVLAAKAVK